MTSTVRAVAESVSSGSASALDSVTEALRRIDAYDGPVHAFQVIRREAALAEARAVDERVAAGESLPLAGVPVAIKDNVPVAGEPMRVGSAATDPAPQPHDHEVVRRWRAAGAVVVGITRVPELCVFGATDSVYGITRNPWALERTPGGSSGGSAAAVAAGMVPLAHGNDGMGSIRIPAACTGLVGIKPGTGVVPCDLGETDWYGMSENGPLATTVDDVALGLSVLAADPDLARVTDSREGPSLRIAVSTRPPVPGVPVDLDHVRGLFTSAAALLRAGHEVSRHDPVYPTGAAAAGLLRWFAGTAGDAAPLDPDLLEPRVRAHAAIGRAVLERDLLDEAPREEWRRRAGELLTSYDVLMTPVLAQPPIAARAWSETSWPATMLANVRYAPFAAPWNVAGFPAMAVPAGVHPRTGTPLSVQLVALPGRERLLLSVAATLESLHPWSRVAPAYADL